MIIIEGPDNAGKTTLGKRIACEIPGLPLVHSPGPFETEQDAIEYTRRTIRERWKGRRCLHDRHPLISEEIYGPILRGKSQLDNFRGKILFDIFLQTYPIVIYCRPPLMAIQDTDETHFAGEDEVNLHLNLVTKRYDAVMRYLEKKGVWVTPYNYLGDWAVARSIIDTVRIYGWSKRGRRKD